MPSGSQRSIGLHLVWLPIHVPRGRPRPIRPSSARWKKTFWETLIDAFVRLAARGRHLLAESRVDRRQLGRARLAQLPHRGQADRPPAPPAALPGSGPMPASVSIAIVRLRSLSATAREAAACTIGTSSIGTRKRVRRIASMRRTLRSSYSSWSIWAGDDADIRARAWRKTLAESVAWRTTTDAAASATECDLRAGRQSMPQADPRATLVGPDAGSRSRARYLARRLASGLNSTLQGSSGSIRKTPGGPDPWRSMSL